jgi:UDP-N-acetylmuramate dehydrogenase
MVLFESFLKNGNFRFQRGLRLSQISYFKSGGIVDFFVEPKGSDELISIIEFCSKNGVNFKIIGLSANILFFDEDFYECVISTKLMTKISIDGQVISAEAGVTLFDLTRYALMHGLSGVEGLEGIPGTVGGAVLMNAGAYGYNISTTLEAVSYYSDDIYVIGRDKCNFAYRQSRFKSGGNEVILDAKFELRKGVNSEIKERMDKFHAARHAYQEYSYPNLGSMFSINRDIYREVFKNSISYTAACIGLKIVLKNRLSKLLMRKNPSNGLFNKLFFLYARRAIRVKFGSRPLAISNKSLNILINNGDYSKTDFLNHIGILREFIDEKFLIENELFHGKNASQNLEEGTKLNERHP